MDKIRERFTTLTQLIAAFHPQIENLLVHFEKNSKKQLAWLY